MVGGGDEEGRKKEEGPSRASYHGRRTKAKLVCCWLDKDGPVLPKVSHAWIVGVFASHNNRANLKGFHFCISKCSFWRAKLDFRCRDVLNSPKGEIHFRVTVGLKKWGGWVGRGSPFWHLLSPPLLAVLFLHRAERNSLTLEHLCMSTGQPVLQVGLLFEHALCSSKLC